MAETKRSKSAVKRTKEQELAAKKAATLKGQYKSLADNEAFIDLQVKIESFSDYHEKIAKDAVGQHADGTIIHLSNELRVSHMDKAAGIQEISDYIDRQLA